MTSSYQRDGKQASVFIFCTSLVLTWLTYVQLNAGFQPPSNSENALYVPLFQVQVATTHQGAGIDTHITATNATTTSALSVIPPENTAKSILRLQQQQQQQQQQQILDSSWGRPSHIIEEPAHVISSTNASCRVLVLQKAVDYHYEVLESVAMRYPLPWHDLKHDCRDSGLTESDPIIIDFAPCFAWRAHLPNYENLEGWGWKRYFEKHLKGRIRKRVNADGRFIQFRAIQGIPSESLPPINWVEYAAQIETTCDTDELFMSAKTWMRKEEKAHFCVVHGESPIHQSLSTRTCYLNPQFAQQCWFIPADYPSFPPPPLPSEDVLRVCIPSYKRNHTPLVQALRELKPRNITIVINGRTARIPHEFANDELSHYVTTNRDAVDYWEFQQSMSKCHVVIPLVENIGATKRYFRGNEP